jgi:hypothetical protein
MHDLKPLITLWRDDPDGTYRTWFLWKDIRHSSSWAARCLLGRSTFFWGVEILYQAIFGVTSGYGLVSLGPCTPWLGCDCPLLCSHYDLNAAQWHAAKAKSMTRANAAPGNCPSVMRNG